MGNDNEKSRDDSWGRFIAGLIACSLWYIYLGVTEPPLVGQMLFGFHGDSHWLLSFSPHAIAFIFALAGNFLWGSDFESGEIALAFCSALCAIIALWLLSFFGLFVWLIVTDNWS